MSISHSAGGVVIGPTGKVLVVSQKGETWSLPKGIIERTESTLETALREIAEESGVRDLTLLRELGTYERCRMGPRGESEDCSVRKRITLFLFRTPIEDLRPEDPVNPEARWVPREEVASLLTHPTDREFYLSIVESLPR